MQSGTRQPCGQPGELINMGENTYINFLLRIAFGHKDSRLIKSID